MLHQYLFLKDYLIQVSLYMMTLWQYLPDEVYIALFMGRLHSNEWNFNIYQTGKWMLGKWESTYPKSMCTEQKSECSLIFMLGGNPLGISTVQFYSKIKF